MLEANQMDFSLHMLRKLSTSQIAHHTPQTTHIESKVLRDIHFENVLGFYNHSWCLAEVILIHANLPSFTALVNSFNFKLTSHV